MATEYLCTATGGYIQHNALIVISDCEGTGIGAEDDAIHANIACENLYVFSGGNIPQSDGSVGHSIIGVEVVFLPTTREDAAIGTKIQTRNDTCVSRECLHVFSCRHIPETNSFIFTRTCQDAAIGTEGQTRNEACVSH